MTAAREEIAADSHTAAAAPFAPGALSSGHHVAPRSPRSLVVIEPSAAWPGVRWRELWQYRELLYFLAWRDVKVRYKQTVLGVLWAVLQPALTMAVFSLFFGRLAGVPSDGVPYPLFALVGLVPWQLFAYAVAESGNSLVTNERLLTKVWFPRLLVPSAAVLAGLVDFAVSATLLVAALSVYGVLPGLRLLALPALLLLAVSTALGVGLWLSALNVQYRDVRYTLPFITQIWLFCTPIAYPASLVPESIRPLLGLNPMAGVVEGFRWSLLGTGSATLPMIVASAVTSAALLISGTRYFRRVEKTFADVV